MRKFLLPAMLSALVLLIAGCSTGDDAVAQGNTFQFVSPGGQTVITYAPDERKPIAALTGEDLVTGQPLSLSDGRFADKVVVVNVWGSWCGPCRGEADDLETVGVGRDHLKCLGADGPGGAQDQDPQSFAHRPIVPPPADVT